jgi:hypothetical protein
MRSPLIRCSYIFTQKLVTSVRGKIREIFKTNPKNTEYSFIRTTFRDVLQCTLVQVHQCFGGTYCLHFQGQRVSQAKLTVVTIKEYYLLGCNVVYSRRSLMFWRSFYLIIWHHIAEDNTLYHHCWEPQIWQQYFTLRYVTGYLSCIFDLVNVYSITIPNSFEQL